METESKTGTQIKKKLKDMRWNRNRNSVVSDNITENEKFISVVETSFATEIAY